MSRRTVVWDLGGVLVDWDPRRLYSRLLGPGPGYDRFAAEVGLAAWHGCQDSGGDPAAATEQLVAAHPARAELIRAFYGQWEQMFAGQLPAACDVAVELAAAGVPMLGLTNWPASMFAVDRRRFPVLDLLDGVVVSGEEGVSKPDPRLYEVLLARYGLDPRDCVYVDDREVNVETARRLGMTGVVTAAVDELRHALAGAGLPVRDEVGLRAATRADLPALTALYRHYVEHSVATFDTDPDVDRGGWFAQFGSDGPHRLVVADRGGEVVGYASSSAYRARPAYAATVETTVYLAPGQTARGVGSMLYQELMRQLRPAGVHLLVAGVALPNAASLALHRRFGFRDVGTMPEVGYKHGEWRDVHWLWRRL